MLAPSEVRAEWAMELQRRGAVCGRYSNMLENAARQNQQLLNMGVQMMQQPANAPTAPPGSVTCFKQREWISGFYKNCVYSCLGSEGGLRS